MQSALTRWMFGTPGDFFDRHQGATLTVACVLILLGSAF